MLALRGRWRGFLVQKSLRFAIGSLLAVTAFGGAVIACDSTLNVDLSGILSGQSGASCTNTTAEAGADAGGCDPGFLCFNTYCVETGPLRISLTFNTDTDLDLHVKTPAGDEIYYGNRTADNGKLDVDQCVSSCGTSSHVENVFFSDPTPQGAYSIFVVNYSARSASDFTIDVIANGQTTTFTGNVPQTDGTQSDTFTYNFPPPALPEAGADAEASTDGAPE
jgi:hypothetical protein